ncbi:isochorismatase family cysteine hydrolase [Streptomyces sp. NPDC051219]|uniref:cysteine hydrolase family protein n=1 Tax=Streptomyces sp. NPDC051219 TaxID=3155283 RepID=UPI00341B64C2
MLQTVLDVQAGAGTRFARIAAPWVAKTTGEAGVQVFLAAFDPSTSQAMFLEVYADSRAFLEHAAAVDRDLRARLYSIAKLRAFHVYGDISDAARAWVDGANPTSHRIEAANTPEGASAPEAAPCDNIPPTTQRGIWLMNAAVDRGSTALVVGDVQNGIVRNFGNDDAYVTRVASAIKSARAAGIQVIYVRVGFRAGHPDVSPRNRGFSIAAANNALLADSDDTQIDARVAPVEGDIVMVKRRVSCFSGTDLNVVLSSRGITSLVLAGIATSGVILSTVREAADRDYALTVLSDGVKDNDEEVHRVLVEKLFPRQADVVSVADWISAVEA